MDDLRQHTPPSPQEILDRIVSEHVPLEHALFDFISPREYARKRLASEMMQVAFGPNHAISRLVQAYDSFDRYPIPTEAHTQTCFEDLEEAWFDLEQELQRERDYCRV